MTQSGHLALRLAPSRAPIRIATMSGLKGRAAMRRRDFIKVTGFITAWPLFAQAQQSGRPVIGFLSSRSPDELKHVLASFHKGLSEAGFIEGTNVAVEYRWALGEYEKLPALAADLVRRNVTVIAAVGGDVSARAAEQATSAIPIVFGAASDVVRAGLVKSLNKPEGNATGFTLLTNDLEPKRLGLLHDLLPKADVAFSINSATVPPPARITSGASATNSRHICAFRRHCRHPSEPRSERSVRPSNPTAQTLAKMPCSVPERLACLLLSAPG